VLAEDGTSTASQNFTWNVNSPISMTTPDDKSNDDGDGVSPVASATGGGTLTYVAFGLRAGLSINPGTGVSSGTGAPGDSGLGSFAPAVLVRNDTDASSINLNWTVGGAISVSDPGLQANTVGPLVSLQVQASDSGSGTLSHADVGLPAGLSINTNTGLLSGTVGSGGTAIGTSTSTARDAFTWAVTAAGAVSRSAPPNQSSGEGAGVLLTLSAGRTGTAAPCRPASAGERWVVLNNILFNRGTSGRPRAQDGPGAA